MTSGVEAAYDAIASSYARRRRFFKERVYVDRVVAKLEPGSRVLDLGCGNGVPIAAYLLSCGLALTGIDVSREQIARAKAKCPAGEFRREDMTRVRFAARSFDAIIAWDSVFHVPRATHATLFTSFRRWLVPGGVLLLSLGGSSWEGHAEMFGTSFFYSGFAPRTSLKLLRNAGLTIELHEVDDPSSRRHMAILASRPG